MIGTATRLDNGALWLDAMRQGDFLAAWDISDRVLADRVASGPCWHLPRHQQWVWTGAPLTQQRVLVRCYHGFGDTIQFARYIALLARGGARVVLEVQPQLKTLLGRIEGVAAVVGRGEPLSAFDVHCPLGSLPLAFKIAHLFEMSIEDIFVPDPDEVTLPPAAHVAR